jgi:hypothetical protein
MQNSFPCLCSTLDPNEVWVLRFEPVAASPAPIEAALPLRHDPFEAQLASFGEHDRALIRERLAE